MPKESNEGIEIGTSRLVVNRYIRISTNTKPYVDHFIVRACV